MPGIESLYIAAMVTLLTVCIGLVVLLFRKKGSAIPTKDLDIIKNNDKLLSEDHQVLNERLATIITLLTELIHGHNGHSKPAPVIKEPTTDEKILTFLSDGAVKTDIEIANGLKIGLPEVQGTLIGLKGLEDCAIADCGRGRWMMIAQILKPVPVPVPVPSEPKNQTHTKETPEEARERMARVRLARKSKIVQPESNPTINEGENEKTTTPEVS